MASRFLNLFCGRCGEHLVLYRKEGSGGLLRLYLDRISGPETAIARWKQAARKPELPPLICSKCENLVGVPMGRESGNRPAFRLIKGSFRRKKSG